MGTDMRVMCWPIPLLEKELALAHDRGLDEGAAPSPGGPKPVANFAEAAPFAMLFTVCIKCVRTKPHEHGVRVGTTSDWGRRPDGPQWRFEGTAHPITRFVTT